MCLHSTVEGGRSGADDEKRRDSDAREEEGAWPECRHRLRLATQTCAEQCLARVLQFRTLACENPRSALIKSVWENRTCGS